MNKNELQVLIDYTKGMIADNKEPEKKVIVALCDELESLIKTNEDNNKLIEAFCADDVDWNKLIDKKNMESSRLIELIMKLADELCNSKRKQMKLGVLYARNHLISAYRANFIECDEKQFAYIMAQLSHVAKESIDIELMMDSVLSCNDEAESWIKETLIKHSK
ncbi:MULTISPECIES: hypothetical protein [Proteus]|uniref:hypothetical protein n=1 Tax=Proteus TaxID=583 RepID=UPI001378345A|nr:MULTISPECIES: hypothetical protein [Proteus]MDK6707868.1 hypothetical protein [Proteus mirabilis]NBM29173.1 hypothetical protein [Proteus sp. G4417]HEK2782043.1 hypothetical protein [Proteus mirabilis]